MAESKEKVVLSLQCHGAVFFLSLLRLLNKLPGGFFCARNILKKPGKNNVEKILLRGSVLKFYFFPFCTKIYFFNVSSLVLSLIFSEKNGKEAVLSVTNCVFDFPTLSFKQNVL